MRLVLVIGVVLAVLQQVTGINVFLYFATEIFQSIAGSRTWTRHCCRRSWSAR